MKKLFIFLILLIAASAPVGLAEAEGVEALVRGETALVRIPCEWLQTYAAVEYPPEARSHGFDSRRFTVDDSWLRENLSDAQYAAFMQHYLQNGSACELFIRDVGLIVDSTQPAYDRLLMNKRLLNGCWYLVFHQEPLNFDCACVYYPTTLFADGKTGRIEAIEHADAEIPEAQISVHRYDAGAGRSIRRAGLNFEIFQGLNTNIVVMSVPFSKDTFMETAVLQIGESLSIELTGYQAGARAAYCCVLNDSELNALENLQNEIALRPVKPAC